MFLVGPNGKRRVKEMGDKGAKERGEKAFKDVEG